jgi:hypothetical protein
MPRRWWAAGSGSGAGERVQASVRGRGAEGVEATVDHHGPHDTMEMQVQADAGEVEAGELGVAERVEGQGVGGEGLERGVGAEVGAVAEEGLRGGGDAGRCRRSALGASPRRLMRASLSRWRWSSDAARSAATSACKFCTSGEGPPSSSVSMASSSRRPRLRSRSQLTSCSSRWISWDVVRGCFWGIFWGSLGLLGWLGEGNGAAPRGRRAMCTAMGSGDSPRWPGSSRGFGSWASQDATVGG